MNQNSKEINYIPMYGGEWGGFAPLNRDVVGASQERKSIPRQKKPGVCFYECELCHKRKKMKLERRNQIIKRILTVSLVTLTVAWGASELHATYSGAKDVYYMVESGDTLTDICKEYDVSMRTIQRDNGISDKNHIQVGDVIAFTTSKKKAKEYREENDMEEYKEEYYSRHK